MNKEYIQAVVCVGGSSLALAAAIYFIDPSCCLFYALIAIFTGVVLWLYVNSHYYRRSMQELQERIDHINLKKRLENKRVFELARRVALSGKNCTYRDDNFAVEYFKASEGRIYASLLEAYLPEKTEEKVTVWARTGKGWEVVFEMVQTELRQNLSRPDGCSEEMWEIQNQWFVPQCERSTFLRKYQQGNWEEYLHELIAKR